MHSDSSRRRKRFALDSLNLFVADVRDGVAPYLALFLTLKPGWTPSRVGLVLAAAGTANLLVSAPLGDLFDSAHRKRALLLFAILTVGLCAFLLPELSQFWPILTIQILIGSANALVGTGIVSLTLGLVKTSDVAARVGRNESLNYAGNCLSALAVVALMRAYPVDSAFFLVGAMSIAAALSLALIKPGEIDNSAARGLKTEREPTPILALTGNPSLLGFLLLAFLFQLANASLLPTLAQKISHRSPEDGKFFVSYGVAVAQLTAVPAAALMGVLSQRISSRFCILIGFLSIACRAALFMCVQNVDLLIGAQAFDGIAAGTLAVAPILAIAELTRGSGHFAYAAGLLATSISLGASLSMFVNGWVTETLGADSSFLSMACVSALGACGLFFHGLNRTRIQT